MNTNSELGQQDNFRSPTTLPGVPAPISLGVMSHPHALSMTERSSRRITTTGLSVVAAIVIVFGGWASIAPLASGVIAEGVIIAEGDRSTVQHLEGGIVKRTLVTDGDIVSAGQVLVQLDDVQAKAKLDGFQADYDGLRARYARLLAEQSNAAQISFPEELLSRATDPRVGGILTAERALFTERRTSLENARGVISQRRALFERQVWGAETQAAANTTQRSIINDELAGLESLFADGYVSRTRLLALKREAARLSGEIGVRTSEAAQAKIRIVELSVEDERTEGDFRKNVMTELRDVQGRLFTVEENIRSAKDALKRLDILAPKAGIVMDLRFRADNTVIAPGGPVLDLVPLGHNLIIEAKVRPTDVDNVATGAEAEIRFPAFRQRTTPSLTGEVLTVSADTLSDSRTGVSYYTARVIIREEERGRLKDKALIPGMPADVTIRAGERTLIEYLVEPLNDVLAHSFKE